MASSEVSPRRITEAMNEVVERGIVPSEWKTSRTILIPKVRKPEPRDPRPIALTNVGYKIFMSLKQFETISFPQDMIQDIYKLHWNIIRKSTGVT